MPNFWDINLGHVITLVGVVVAYLSLKQSHKDATKTSDAHREQIASKLADLTQERHEEHIDSIHGLKLEITKLEHLDECMDSMKEEIVKMRERLHALEKAIWAIGRSRDRGEMG